MSRCLLSDDVYRQDVTFNRGVKNSIGVEVRKKDSTGALSPVDFQAENYASGLFELFTLDERIRTFQQHVTLSSNGVVSVEIPSDAFTSLEWDDRPQGWWQITVTQTEQPELVAGGMYAMSGQTFDDAPTAYHNDAVLTAILGENSVDAANTFKNEVHNDTNVLGTLLDNTNPPTTTKAGEKRDYWDTAASNADTSKTTLTTLLGADTTDAATAKKTSWDTAASNADTSKTTLTTLLGADTTDAATAKKTSWDTAASNADTAIAKISAISVDATGAGVEAAAYAARVNSIDDKAVSAVNALLKLFNVEQMPDDAGIQTIRESFLSNGLTVSTMDEDNGWKIVKYGSIVNIDHAYAVGAFASPVPANESVTLFTLDDGMRPVVDISVKPQRGDSSGWVTVKTTGEVVYSNGGSSDQDFSNVSVDFHVSFIAKDAE